MKLKYLILILLIFNKKGFSADISSMFNEGDYEGVIESINSSKIPYSSDQRNYLIGVSAFRINKYELAVNYLEKIKNKHQYQDVDYLIAQIYYSMENLKKSANFFKRSIKLKYKEDASLYYLGTIHKELGLYNDAKKYFKQIHDVAFPELSFIQAAHHQTGLLYLDGYIRTKKLSQKVIRKKVIPRLQYAIKSAPELPLANIIRDEIKLIKRKYLNENEVPSFKVNFNQFFNYNTNVIYQSISPTINNNSSSGLLNSAITVNHHYKSNGAMRFENISTFLANHQYHLAQNDPNIARYDGITLGLRNQFLFKSPFQKKYAPIWLILNYRNQRMNNNFSGELTYDNKSSSIALGSQLTLLGLKPSVELKFESFKNFTSLNDQKIYSINSILPLNFNKYLLFYLIGDIKISRFSNSPEFSNNQITGTLSHILNFNEKNRLITSGTVGLIDTRNMRDQRGIEILFAPQINFHSRFKKYFNWGLNYRFEKKISKDQSTFAYQQHVVGLSLGVDYE